MVPKHWNPPKGVLRWLARLPILLYRLGLGWILGKRFLMLYHLGRHSQKTRTVVLEVIHHQPEDDSYLVSSAFGEKADWWKNLRQTPSTRIQVGSIEKEVLAVFLGEDEARAELERYAREHPAAARMFYLMFRTSEEQTWPDLASNFRLVRLLRMHK